MNRKRIIVILSHAVICPDYQVSFQRICVARKAFQKCWCNLIASLPVIDSSQRHNSSSGIRNVSHTIYPRLPSLMFVNVFSESGKILRLSPYYNKHCYGLQCNSLFYMSVYTMFLFIHFRFWPRYQLNGQLGEGS